MDGFLLRIRRHLPGVRGRPSKQEACTLQLPVELVDAILHHLSSESVICLALTCRALFVRYFPRPAHLTDKAKTTLLQYLERDHPRLYFCHDCTRLHRWRLAHIEEGIWVYSGPCFNKLGFGCYGVSSGVATYGMNLTYALARIVMNRHLYGSACGPSAKSLAVTNSLQHDFYGTRITRSWNAKIINDSLYLHGRVVFQMLGREGDLGKLRELFVFLNSHLVCPHVQPPPGYAYGSLPLISELCWDGDSLDAVEPESGGIRSCRVCFTDYRVDVELRERPRLSCGICWPRGETWAVEINRWHKLGGCRSPYDLEWYSFANWYLGQRDVQRQDVCGAGMIRREWMGGEAEDGEGEEASFV
ncbi:hypothetical protein QBC41DRAFT_229415 [Cercophora samala]|uniref:F-box domain-containing protein n=1 Tax=Cercophora samala TaxID=330535 RepID=A0AA39Z9V5_9PEZI|nr:hypothetical protein QBC41DRAFT_229415 [Cercophora samala]